MAQSVKGLTLGFGSAHDLTVCGFEPCVRFCDGGTEPAWASLSPSLSAPAPLVLCLSLSNKYINLKKKKVCKSQTAWVQIRLCHYGHYLSQVTPLCLSFLICAIWILLESCEASKMTETKNLV